MKAYVGKFILFVSTCLCVSFMSSAMCLAVQYIYYDGGLNDPTVGVVNQVARQGVFEYAVETWNNTDTPVSIIEVTGTGYSYCVDGEYNDTWYGLYTVLTRVFGSWGRARKFKIQLNKSEMIGATATFWKSVLVHEFGHAFCLGDNPSYGDQSIMNYSRNRNYLKWPTGDDIAGVNNAY